MRKLLLTLAAALLSSAAASAQGSYSDCGTLVSGVTCPLFFQSDSGGLYLLDNYGSYQLGDVVQVQGTLDPNCFTICIQGDGCITVSSIGDCTPSNSATPYCFGDGSGASCSCGNNAGVGEGCANSSGSGAVLAAAGSDQVSNDDLAFSASGLLPSQPALLFSGTTANNGGLGIPFGDGLRCAGGAVLRHGTQTPDSNGDVNWPTGLAVANGWAAGDTRYFQTWYRDPIGSPCGAGFNLSQGISVTFTP
jgi:hypothetical protein